MRSFLIILSSLILFSSSNPVRDAGSCVKYQIITELTSGKQVKGWTYVGGYDMRFKFDTISFLSYLNEINSLDTFNVFQNIRSLKFPITDDGRHPCQFYFDAVAPENVTPIDKSTVKSIQVLSYTTCNNCDEADEKIGYYWNGIYPVIITELTKTEIDLLQTKPVAQLGFGHGGEWDVTSFYWMVSYSKAYTQLELQKIQEMFLANEEQLFKQRKGNVIRERFFTLKKDLQKKNIILFKVEYAL